MVPLHDAAVQVPALGQDRRRSTQITLLGRHEAEMLPAPASYDHMSGAPPRRG